MSGGEGSLYSNLAKWRVNPNTDEVIELWWQGAIVARAHHSSESRWEVALLLGPSEDALTCESSVAAQEWGLYLLNRWRPSSTGAMDIGPAGAADDTLLHARMR